MAHKISRYKLNKDFDIVAIITDLKEDYVKYNIEINGEVKHKGIKLAKPIFFDIYRHEE